MRPVLHALWSIVRRVVKWRKVQRQKIVFNGVVIHPIFEVAADMKSIAIGMSRCKEVLVVVPRFHLAALMRSSGADVTKVAAYPDFDWKT